MPNDATADEPEEQDQPDRDETPTERFAPAAVDLSSLGAHPHVYEVFSDGAYEPIGRWIGELPLDPTSVLPGEVRACPCLPLGYVDDVCPVASPISPLSFGDVAPAAESGNGPRQALSDRAGIGGAHQIAGARRVQSTSFRPARALALRRTPTQGVPSR